MSRARHDRVLLRFTAAVALFTLTSCQAPTSPDGGDSLNVICPATLLIGEVSACEAVVQSQTQPWRDVTPAATWTALRTDIVSVGPWSLVAGRAAGQGEIAASYQGRTGGASIAVIAEDAIRIRAAAEQGPFRRGVTVTMFLQGYWSVASADTGRLFLLITDQDGTTVASSDPLTVAKGGTGFVLSKAFVIPDTSTAVCRTAILEVGPVTIAQPNPGTLGRCIAVQP